MDWISDVFNIKYVLMKNIKKVIVLVLFLSVISFLGYKISSKIGHKKEIVERTKTIPSFSFLDTYNNLYSNKNLPNIPLSLIHI